MDDKHNKLKRRPSTASSSIGPRGRIDKKRGTRRRKKRHRQFHSKQLADRETSWFQSYDYTYNAIYYYDETNQESEEISHWERPDELEMEDYLAEEWETTLDPTTSHYFFTSRLWPRVVVWHVPKDVDWKRKAHVERVELRWSVASQIMEDMICVLETVDSSKLRFWPHDEKEEKRQLGVSWETREGRAELKRMEREVVVVVVESIEEEEGEGSDTDEAGIHAEEDKEEVTSVLVSVSDGEEDEGGEEKKEEEEEEEATTGAAAAAVSTEDASISKTRENVLLDWVLEINDKDEMMTDEWKSRLIGCGEVYELNEKQTLLDIVEAMVLMVEEIIGSEMEKERRKEEKEREERERIEEEQRKREEGEEGEEEEKGTTNTEKNDVVDPAEKVSSEAADEKHKEDEDEKQEELEQLQQQQSEATEKKKDLDDAVLSSLWATMSTHDQHTTRRQRLRSGAQAMIHVTMSHSHHALREARNMAQYHQRLGTLWMKHEQEHRMSEVTQCLENILETVIWQHEQWESKRTVHEREKYFCTLVDQYMVRGYGENYEGRAVR